MSEIFILVDFDNINKAESRLGVEYLIRKVFSICDSKLRSVASHAVVRLYGGWYEQGRMTYAAQRLAGDIVLINPVRIVRSDKSILWVRAELANALLADPVTLVDNTFRRRQAQSNLKCRRAPWAGCANHLSCTCAQFEIFFNAGCSEAGCTVRGLDVLERSEQKVVDSMLVADLIFASRQQADVVLVSRDDDMWPGLRMATASGCTVVHLLTSAGSSLPNYYSSLRGGAYSCEVWR